LGRKLDKKRKKNVAHFCVDVGLCLGQNSMGTPTNWRANCCYHVHIQHLHGVCAHLGLC